MSAGSADTSLSITPFSLSGRRNAEASKDAPFLADPNFSSALLTQAPASDAAVRLPKGRVARQLPALPGFGATPLFRRGVWRRRRSMRTLIAWSYWRNEIEIRRTTRALAEFDDCTLHDLGIRDRSQIEFTVRFCRDC